ncbi:hypothetical protein [Methanobacterium aggregans]|uniref:hypothetical protein n=1 Tax=Methanobacterium aggregans TaxID=1615586 RepID=UPI001AE294C4|nr:hypothetical protein [Methanobacterium aggregans]MBP2045148.1 hypothetical protein [Methanobacterium aggregans]
MYKNIDAVVKGEHDPDILYFFIKQSIKNLGKEKRIDITVPEEKKLKINLIFDLEVFRAVMQYIEEFGIYFLSNINKSSDLSKSIVETRPNEIKTAFQNFIDDGHNDFAKKKGYKDYKDLLKQVFSITSQSINADRKEVYGNLKNCIDMIAWFFIYYSDLYNAIKHGSRVFPQNYHKMDIIDNKNETILTVNIDEPYFEAICKDSKKSTSDVYAMIYPVNLLITDSIRILEDVHEIFNFLRKTNKYKKSSSFNYKIIDNFLGYKKIYNEDHSIFLTGVPELDKISSGEPILYAKISIKGNTIEYHISNKKSIEYPFSVRFGQDYSHSPKPGTKSDLKISSSLYMDVEQLHNMIKLKELASSHNNINVLFIDDKTGIKSDKMEYGGLNFPYLPLKYDVKVIKFLLKLKKITNEIIPTPTFLSDSQKEILTSNINRKNWTQAKAKKVLDNIKNNKKDIVSFFIKKIYPDGTELEKQFLGSTENLNSFGLTAFNENSKKKKKFNIKDLVNKDCKIERTFTDPNKFIEGLKSSLRGNNINSTIETKYNDEEFGMQLTVELNEEYWYNEYIVLITIEFRNKTQS